MQTMTIGKVDKDFKVEIIKGNPRHSDIKKLLKSDFNFIKGICEVYIVESYHKTVNVKILLTDGQTITYPLDVGKGKSLVDEINSIVTTSMRIAYNSGSFFIPDDMSFEQFKDSYVDKVSATLPIISKELETKMKLLHSNIEDNMETYKFIAKIA